MEKASKIIESTEPRQERVQSHIRDGAEVFHNEEGSLFTRGEAVKMIQDECDVSESISRDVLSELVADTVDPVVQVQKGQNKYVGVVEFHEFDGAYGYLEWNDEFGEEKRVVCQKCVNTCTQDSNVTFAAEGRGSFDEGSDYSDLLDKVHQHYEAEHDDEPDNVETGATLASGSTIGGNTSWHDGNVTGGSNINVSSTQIDVSGLTNYPGQFGDESDGSVTISSNSSYTSKVLNTTSFTLQSGNTLTVNNHLVILSTGTVTLDGTIDGDGKGGGGGGAGSFNGSGGSDGQDGALVPLGRGGGGGSGGGSGGNGGNGGDGDTRPIKYKDNAMPSRVLQAFTLDTRPIAAGGGGGGASADGIEESASSGGFPGGGGGGDETDGDSSGGNGGNGASGVVVIAKSINVGGTFNLRGQDGDDGSSAGGGGGGSGGAVFLISHDITDNGTYNLGGGSRGSGGSAGREGADGADGYVVKYP